MREIKFRAWDSKNKVWVKRFNITSDGKFSIGNGAQYSYIELTQFIGLKDKNEVEIYEKDIIETCSGNYPVEFCSGAFRLHKNCCDCVDMPEVGKTIIGELKVIGNIYENKDLLND